MDVFVCEFVSSYLLLKKYLSLIILNIDRNLLHQIHHVWNISFEVKHPSYLSVKKKLLYESSV